jgi:hypothetical protein
MAASSTEVPLQLMIRKFPKAPRNHTCIPPWTPHASILPTASHQALNCLYMPVINSTKRQRCCKQPTTQLCSNQTLCAIKQQATTNSGQKQAATVGWKLSHAVPGCKCAGINTCHLQKTHSDIDTNPCPTTVEMASSFWGASLCNNLCN